MKLREEAIKPFESGGDYQAIGPLTKYGRAYGAYQVLEGNIGPWTKKYCGRAYTINEFLADRDCQDIVAGREMTNGLRVYGTHEDPVSIWFTGDPFEGNTECDTVVNVCVGEYVPRAINNLKK